MIAFTETRAVWGVRFPGTWRDFFEASWRD